MAVLWGHRGAGTQGGGCCGGWGEPRRTGRCLQSRVLAEGAPRAREPWEPSLPTEPLSLDPRCALAVSWPSQTPPVGKYSYQMVAGSDTAVMTKHKNRSRVSTGHHCSSGEVNTHTHAHTQAYDPHACTHTCSHNATWSYVFTYTSTHSQPRPYTHMHTHTHACTHIHVHTLPLTCMLIHMHSHTPTHSHTQPHTQMHAHIFTCMHTHALKHSHTLPCRSTHPPT